MAAVVRQSQAQIRKPAPSTFNASATPSVGRTPTPVPNLRFINSAPKSHPGPKPDDVLRVQTLYKRFHGFYQEHQSRFYPTHTVEFGVNTRMLHAMDVLSDVALKNRRMSKEEVFDLLRLVLELGADAKYGMRAAFHF